MNSSFLRLDRSLTLYFFGALKRVLPRPRGIRIPILMYHSISDEPENGIHPYYRINTSAKRFAEHMQFLHDKNYKVISLSDAVRFIKSSNQPKELNEPDKLNPPPSTLDTNHFVVLTFDDGYKDFLPQAFPVLKKHGFSATVFLPTSFIDGAGKPGLKGKQHLGWDEVRELRGGGTSFGSHSVSHRQLRGLSRTDTEYEIKKSKEVIEKELRQSIESFCYPYKFMEQDKEFIRMTKAVLIDAGYKSAVATRIGTINTQDDIFMLKRIPVNSGDEGEFFRAKLEGNYDWLQIPQKLTKYFRT